MAADLQSHFQYWKSFNLIGLQKELDVTANDLAARQDESDNSRRKLVEQSREFKKVTAEDVRKQVAPLLKSFQVEIDSLSKRSKAAEAAFLTIYKRLIDVPDPLPAFEQSLMHQRSATRLSDIEIENSKLRETLAEYNSEFAEVKSQDVTIKQLKDKIKDYENRIENEVQTRSAGQEKELNRQYQEKEKQLHETQLSFAKRLGIAEQQMNTLRAALEASQSELFEVKSKHEQSTAAKSDEMDMLISDLERANERASLAERQVENLRVQLATLQGSLQQRDTSNQELDLAIDQMKRSNLELELTAKEKEVTQLVEEVQKMQISATKQQAEFNARVSRLEDELARKDEQVSSLSQSLSQQADYEELRKELEIMKSLEFSNTESSSQADRVKSLETLLLEKNRALQSENTKLKNSNVEITEGVKIEPEIDIRSPMSRFSDHSFSSLPAAVDSSSAAAATALAARCVSEDNGWLPCHTAAYLPTRPDFLKECLDTLDVSNRVKELLSVHNIGQRVFAKQVLGLSQGTVSELLSKPKHWDKLTEKGRESYRKMYYWLQDIRNIDALKNASPRKPPGLFNMSKQDSLNAEERIAQILRDAQNAMVHKNHEALHNNRTPQSQQSQHSSHSSSSNINNNNNSKYINSSPAGSERLEQRRGSSSSLSTHLQCQPPTVSQLSLSQQQSESSQAIVSRIYEEELSKLAEQAKQSGNMNDYHLYQTELQRILGKKAPQSPSYPAPDLQDEPQDLSLAPNPSSTKQELQLSRSSSPLQQMQNITNQFLSTSQAHLLQQKPLKHVLPPISQDQFDKYTGLNTEDLVKKVKELLSQFSISQRLFGENVLGLSQGSVSDLLARPKPWSMLTQKGREPFIRMKIFSEDPEAVKKLMSNQYRAGLTNDGSNRMVVPPSRDSPPPAPPVAPAETPERCQSGGELLMDWVPTMVPNPLHASMMQGPSFIELVAATGELDTLFVTSRVKEMLQFHNIGQKLFGEAILGLSQGSVSDMLSKPKPWHLLSLKGREPFVRMHIWLTDPMNILRLKSYQAQVKAFRRRSGSCGTVHEDDRSSPFYSKKPRYSFTEEQKSMLREAFRNDAYPSATGIETLANKMDLSAKTVINWFHNHRMRSKQQNRDDNGKVVNGVYIKQEPDSNSLDGTQFSSQNSYTTDSHNSSPNPSVPVASPDSTNNPIASPVLDGSQVSQQQCTSTPLSNGNMGRKRKNANPQYVSAGAVLDKHNSSEEDDGLEIDVTSLSEPVLSSHADPLAATATTEGRAEEDMAEQASKAKIAKLEQRVREDDMKWEDEQVDRLGCLQKLESRVNTDSNDADDWEF